MSATVLASFFDDRWEQDRIQHFYYLATPAYRRLSVLAKHVVLKGHRGTGKTTLLRALDWRERLANGHLRAALGADPFADHVIGCFLQIKLLPVDILDIWLRRSRDQIKYALISSYLRASWIVEMCSAIRGLNEVYQFASYSEELDDLREVAPHIWDWIPEALKIRPVASSSIVGIDDIDRIGRALMKHIRDAAAIEIPSPEEVLARLDLLELGTLVPRLFAALAEHVARLGNGKPWIFRVCLDEGEFLSNDWAVAVRTLIRETDAPVYLAVSVLHSLGTSTRAVGASLSIDDREVVDLDDRPVDQMADLLNGILRARLQQFGITGDTLDLRSYLGNPDLDELFEIAISRSEKRSVERFRNRPITAAKASPIREHLLSREAIRATPQRSRRDESAGYRKKKIAGYLSLLGSLGIERPTYAGWRIAVHMADNSVRDFIRFLRYAMESWANRDSESTTDIDVARFFSIGRVDYRLQDMALERLGRQKLESMANTMVDHVSASAVVRLFGEISHRADFHSPHGLGKPNANQLVVRDPGRPVSDGPTYLSLLAVLQEAASYGYVADLDEKHGRVSCRVNRSFARYLGFSYWKPQYETSVHFDVVERAMRDPAGAPGRWLDGMPTSRPLGVSAPTLPGFSDRGWTGGE